MQLYHAPFVCMQPPPCTTISKQVLKHLKKALRTHSGASNCLAQTCTMLWHGVCACCVSCSPLPLITLHLWQLQVKP